MSESESSEVLFGEPAMPSRERLQAQLAAVELLLARPDRNVAHHDILIATALELLAPGPLTTAQLLSKVRESWPGLRLLTSQLEAALAAAAAVHNVQHVLLPGGLDAWELLPAGRTELDESATKGNEIIARFRSQISDELRRRTGECRMEDLESVAELVSNAIRASIGKFFELKDTARIERAGGWLRVRGSEAMDIERWIRERTSDSEQTAAILTITMAALDQSTAFGSEMVHHLVTGHLLYLFMARPDEILAATSAGPLDGELLIIDTPMIFRLADEPRLRQPLLELLTAAQKGGMRVTVSERTMAEFERHLKALQNHEVPGIDRALRQGASPTVLAGLQRQVRLLNIWLRWAAHRPAESRSWSSFLAYLKGVEGPANLLSAISVETQPIRQPKTADDRAVAERLRGALVAQTTSNGVRNRGDSAIEHDILMLTAIHESRVDNPSSHTKVWPGAFCLTTDRQLDEVYTKVFGEEPFPVALTVSQLAQIVGAYCDPSASEALALQVAGGLLEAEMVKRTAAIPVELAQLMAMAVAEESPTDVELEQLEFDIRGALESSRLKLEAGTIQHDDLVRRITESRRARKVSAFSQAENAAEAERRRNELELTRRDEQIRASSGREADLRMLVATREAELAASRQEHDSELIRIQNRKREDRRKHGVDLASLAIIGAAVVCLTQRQVLPTIALSLGAFFVWIYGREWAAGESSRKLVLASVVTALATVVPVVNAMVQTDESPTTPTPSSVPTESTATD